MRILGRLAIVAAFVVSAGAAAPLSAGATALPTATCSGTAGSVGFAPGLKLVEKKVQDLSIANATLTCTGGWVTAGTMKTVDVAPLRQKEASNCQDLLAGIATKTPKWVGSIRVAWTAPVGMQASKANVSAYVTSSTGASTSFHYSGDVMSQNNLFSGHHVSGNFTINKGLHSTASGGSCSVINAITSGGITASSLKIS